MLQSVKSIANYIAAHKRAHIRKKGAGGDQPRSVWGWIVWFNKTEDTDSMRGEDGMQT